MYMYNTHNMKGVVQEEVEELQLKEAVVVGVHAFLGPHPWEGEQGGPLVSLWGVPQGPQGLWELCGQWEQ